MKYIYILIILIIILVLLYIFTPYINIEKFANSEFLFNTYPLIFVDQDSKDELGTFPIGLTEAERSGYDLTYINIKKGEKGDTGPPGPVGPETECQGNITIDSITSSGDLDINVNNLDIKENGSINFNKEICFGSDKCINDYFINKVKDINTSIVPALNTCQDEKALLDSSLGTITTEKQNCDNNLVAMTTERDDLRDRGNDYLCKINDYQILTKHLKDTISYALDEINNNWVKKGEAEFDDLKSDIKQQYVRKFNFPLINFKSEKDGSIISTYPDPDDDPVLHQQVANLGNEIDIIIPQGIPGNPGPRGAQGPRGASGNPGSECFTNYEKFTDISLTNMGGPFIRFINQDTGEIQATIPKNFPSEKEIQDSNINVIDIPLYTDPDLKGPPGPPGNRGGPGYRGPQGTCCPRVWCWWVTDVSGDYLTYRTYCSNFDWGSEANARAWDERPPGGGWDPIQRGGFGIWIR